MISVRRNTFETNSSSTHSICIPNKKEVTEKDYGYPNYFEFYIGEFGWEFDSVNPTSYLFTAIGCLRNRQEFEDKVRHMIKVLIDRGETNVPDIDYIDLSYCYKRVHTDEYYPTGEKFEGYIDHACDGLDAVINYLFENDNRLYNFMKFGKVYTGNDNCAHEEFPATFSFMPEFINHDYIEETNANGEKYWTSVEKERIKNYMHKPHLYEYMVKDN